MGSRSAVLAATLLVTAGGLEAQQVNTLAWMAGCWRQLDAGVTVEEVWLAPAGGTMIGLSRSVEDDSTRSTEHMVIRPAASGGLVYEAAPSGQEPGAFLAATVTDSLVIFENLTHDFPQQIRYSRLPGDSLLAVVSGTVRERLRTITFRYSRSTCPGS
ncbi:MAG TPA: DUF6265 family protein [Gemmatimonadales bacterium]|nr:DUF6265 family protein [Gemmatimonadales bacterium]